MTSGSYLRHDGPPIIALYIAEGHLRAFILVDLELRVVHEWNLVHRCYAMVSGLHGKDWTNKLQYFDLEQRFSSREQQYRSSSVWDPIDVPGNPSYAAQMCDLQEAGSVRVKSGYRGQCNTYPVGDHLLYQC
jgi:hypothetical protein